MHADRRTILTYIAGIVSGAGAVLASIPFFRSLGLGTFRTPPQVDIEIAKLQEGQLTVVALRHGPLYILKRGKEQIVNLKVPSDQLLDPFSEMSHQSALAKNAGRSVRPDVFVAWGVCTHVGCSVAYNPPGHLGEFGEPYLSGGFICPCHSSAYDLAGRVFKDMPAPRNLDIPEYEFLDEHRIRVTDLKSV